MPPFWLQTSCGSILAFNQSSQSAFLNATQDWTVGGQKIADAAVAPTLVLGWASQAHDYSECNRGGRVSEGSDHMMMLLQELAALKKENETQGETLSNTKRRTEIGEEMKQLVQKKKG